MRFSRRRFLTIASASCLTPALTGQAYAAPDVFRWQGRALGGAAQIILAHEDAAQITALAAQELARLEDVFSLYCVDSQLRRLNDTGLLQAPAFELVECLTLARRVHRATEGRFDPTIQPLWAAYADARTQGIVPTPEDLAAARQRVGFDQVEINAGQIRLGQGQALTLNGIAQGFIADQVADVIRAAGVSDVLVDTGEIVAAGSWPVTIAGENDPRDLVDRALATSAMMGMQLSMDEGGAPALGHILDPRYGALSTEHAAQVSVSAGRAGVADALSTALVLTQSRREAEGFLSSFSGAKLESYLPS